MGTPSNSKILFPFAFAFIFNVSSTTSPSDNQSTKIRNSSCRSDKAIASLVLELETLKDSVGKELCLKHIYSGKKHIGVVKAVTPDEVELDDNGKKFKLKLSNIRILGDDERIEFKAERYGTSKRDFSFVFDEGADEEFISDLLRPRISN